MKDRQKKIKLPRGLSDFSEIRSEGFLYIDKSKFIVEFAEFSGQTVLFPRPRRFGKTLNMTMLKAWYEGIPSGSSPEQQATHQARSRDLFAGLAADSWEGEHQKRRAKIPVIFLSFKDVKESNWESVLDQIAHLVAKECERLRSWWEGQVLSSHHISNLTELLHRKANRVALTQALTVLCSALHEVSGEKVLILIDEYDTPIQQGYMDGYLGEAVGFFRTFLSAGLKDNPHLHKGALTGILRVSKENLFSGLNNLTVCSILSEEFSEFFGLLEHEVEGVFAACGISPSMPEARHWYNGYVFGKTTVYNPWSIVSFASSPQAGFLPYWVNTADSSLVGSVISRGGSALREELFTLLRGGSVEKEIDENVTFSPQGVPEDKSWSFLLFTGYLKQSNYRREGLEFKASLTIPNFEVAIAFHNLVKEWLSKRVQGAVRLQELTAALTSGDSATFHQIFQEFVINCLSVHDVPAPRAEQVYHSFAIGLLTALYSTHQVKSNLESGLGRPDLLIIPHDKTKLGTVMEFKIVGKGQTPELALDSAQKQIEDKKYVSLLHDSGCVNTQALAIAFHGKEVFLREVLQQ